MDVAPEDMDVALVCARFVHFVSTMGLFGACFFVSVLAPASLTPELSPLLRRFAAPLALLSLASAVAWLVFVARGMAGGDFDLGALGEVVRGTSFGVVWQGRLLILAGLLVATLRPDRRWRAPTLIAALGVASLALVGHAAMQDGALGLGHRLNHSAHLLATSGWLGGLPPFLLCLRAYCRIPYRGDALGAMMRYSHAGHFAVAAVFLTGSLDVAMTTHALPWPPSSPYRAGLCAKIVVFAAMTGLALVNRYVFAPKARTRPAAARALGAGALAEIALALTAIALVSAFATFNPVLIMKLP